ncbi:MAG: MbnP family copper-binding protein [Ardenticatenaceae bacterium]
MNVSRLTLFLLGVVMTMLALAGCGSTPATNTDGNITLQFAFKAGEEDVACGKKVAGLGSAGTTAEFTDLRFYVSNVRLINEQGEAVPLELEQDGLWQSESTALLDFEDASASCSENGTSEVRDTVVGTVPAGMYNEIVFELGVPFEVNHADVTTAPSPLNVSALWWNWQGGYKFARIDMLTDQPENNAWLIHLGSTGCESEDKNTPATTCNKPNRPEIRLSDFDPQKSVIVADVASLLANINISESTPKPPGCMSGPDDPDCTNLIAGFGLVQASGQCENGCAQQAFFRLQ